jgi:small-conductance mechanosensitive channel
MNLLNVATILCIGLLIGAELAMSVFVNPILWKLDVAPQAGAIRLFARRLGAAMPVWYIASLLFLLSETITHRHESLVVMLGVATAIWVAAIVLSLLFLVPINNRMARMDADELTETARRQHRKWDGLHRVRVSLLAVAMIFFLAGIGI